VVVRFPFSTDYQDREGTIKAVDWIAVDLDFLNRYGVAFRGIGSNFATANAGSKTTETPTAFKP
jgi:hypothetical protein